MSARALVFDVGDRVRAYGKFIADAEGEWLDLNRVSLLEYRAERSRRSVRLVGADAAAVPTEFGPATMPGWATVTGTWLGDAIAVDGQSPQGPGDAERRHTSVPCPPPPGGWPMTDTEDDQVDLGDLQASGAAVTVVWHRLGPRQKVLVVAAADPRAVEALLRLQLGDRLCIVPSRWTWPQIAQVLNHARAHFRDWDIQTITEAQDEQAQRRIDVGLTRVLIPVAEWADTIPDGLLHLCPYIAPV